MKRLVVILTLLIAGSAWGGEKDTYRIELVWPDGCENTYTQHPSYGELKDGYNHFRRDISKKVFDQCKKAGGCTMGSVGVNGAVHYTCRVIAQPVRGCFSDDKKSWWEFWK